ncbi:hypothetical protein DDW13_07420 [Acidianus hospitalis]|uniref:Uncharacterized protein n=1 Tax=Acidianus hospitalis TaxID=563177 RepID=A0A2T9X2X8_9CREN|nr:hypothetical protein DDW13_07420 [Acidianus hospitalis]
MEKFFQIDNVDLNSIHDRITSEIQNQGMEIHKDEPRDNGFKLFVRRGEEHGEVEVFNDWGGVKVITHGRLEWDLMNIVEPIMQQPQAAPQGMPTQVQQNRPPMPSPSPAMPQQPMMPHPMVPQPNPAMQPAMVPHPTMPPTTQAAITPEHQQFLGILTQNGYQIMVNNANQGYFFIRGRKGNFVIDIEGREQPS